MMKKPYYNIYHNISVYPDAKFKIKHLKDTDIVWAWCDKIKDGYPGKILQISRDRIKVLTTTWHDSDQEVILTFKLKKMRGLKVWYCFYKRDLHRLANYDEKRWWFKG